MKIPKLTLPLAFAAAFVACSQIDPIPRDQLLANMGPILRVEKRFDQVRYYTQMLGSLGEISEGKTKELKKHLDIYYIYYLASNIHLARGNMESYLAHVKLAERELDVMEAILKDGLAKEWELDPSGESNFSKSNL